MSKYWNKQGRYQAEFEAMSEQLMPAMGEADTLGGELVRSANRLYYDAFNNGFCNNTSGAVKYIAQYLCPHYADSKELLDALRFIDPKTNTGGYSNVCKHTEQALDTVVDYVAHFVLTKPEQASTANPIDMLELNDADYYEEEEDEDYWDDEWEEEEDY